MLLKMCRHPKFLLCRKGIQSSSESSQVPNGIRERDMAQMLSIVETPRFNYATVSELHVIQKDARKIVPNTYDVGILWNGHPPQPLISSFAYVLHNAGSWTRPLKD
jgi:hypothetical protein